MSSRELNRYWETVLDMDRRMRDAGVGYCVIKSCIGNLDYFDSNIDVVCDVPMEEVHRRVYPERVVTRKDGIKARYYERNKLMLTDPEHYASDIHLHTNAGWHDLEFVSGEEILANRMDLELEGRRVQIVKPDVERKILALHVMFENFFKRRWDPYYVGPDDYDAFATEYGVPPSEIAPIKAAERKIPIRALLPIWRRYYRQRGADVTLRNRFLHLLSVGVYFYRRARSARR